LFTPFELAHASKSHFVNTSEQCACLKKQWAYAMERNQIVESYEPVSGKSRNRRGLSRIPYSMGAEQRIGGGVDGMIDIARLENESGRINR
jgi:hypothetical protein